MISRARPVDGVVLFVFRWFPVSNASQLSLAGRVSTIGDLEEGDWKWHGGSLGVDGAIYGIPAHADSVLKIQPKTGEVKSIGSLSRHTADDGVGINKLDFDLETPLLRTSPAATSDIVLRCKHDLWPKCSVGFAELLKNVQDGWVRLLLVFVTWLVCVCVFVLCIICVLKASMPAGGPFPGKYKWLGAVLGSDGCLYGIPYNAQKILKSFGGTAEGCRRLVIFCVLAFNGGLEYAVTV